MLLRFGSASSCLKLCMQLPFPTEKPKPIEAYSSSPAMLYRSAVPVPADALVQRNVEFARTAWRAGLRPDQREANQLRVIEVEFPLLSRDVVQVRCGNTVATAAVTCDLVEPMPFRPKHGFFEVHARQLLHERDPLDQPKEVKRVSMHLTRLLAGSVIETEGLCVIPGRRVWSIDVEVMILNNDGNIHDVAQWAVMVALQHVRRPELTIRGDDVVVHPPHERDPVPLSLHHVPLSFTFAVCANPQQVQLAARAAALKRAGSGPAGSSTSTTKGSGDGEDGEGGDDEALAWSSDALQVVVDPSLEEAAAAACTVSVAVNAEGHVCSLEKADGCDVSIECLQQCMDTAIRLTQPLLTQMKESMEAHDVKRKEAVRSQFLWAQQRLGIQAAAAPQNEQTTKRSKTEA
jgi:exosome complex component RRP45